jgi:hypothetical protein
MTGPDIAGVVGVGLILAAYGGVQLERLDPRGLLAGFANLTGALLILLSLAYDFNLSAVLMEGAWALFAALGIVRTLLRRRRAV